MKPRTARARMRATCRFPADWRKWREQSDVVKIAQTSGSACDNLQTRVD
jgi:hypothetical protein